MNPPTPKVKMLLQRVKSVDPGSERIIMVIPQITATIKTKLWRVNCRQLREKQILRRACARSWCTSPSKSTHACIGVRASCEGLSVAECCGVWVGTAPLFECVPGGSISLPEKRRVAVDVRPLDVPDELNVEKNCVFPLLLAFKRREIHSVVAAPVEVKKAPEQKVVVEKRVANTLAAH